MAAGTALASLLSDIGAADLSAAVTDDTEAVGIFAGHRARLEQEIGAVQLRIHRCLQQNRKALERQREATASLDARLQRVERDLADANESLYHPQDGLQPQLLVALEAHADLQRETLTKQTITRALASLKAQHDHLAALSRCRDAGHLDQATEVLVRAETDAAHAPGWLHAMPCWKRGRSSLAEQRSALERTSHDLVFDEGMVVDARDPDGTTFAVSTTVRYANTTLPLASVVTSLDRLGMFEKDFTKLIARVTDSFLRGVVADSHASVESTDQGVRIRPCQTPVAPISDLSTVMRYLSKALLPVLPVRLRAIIAERLGEAACRCVVDDVLLASLPSSLSLELLEAYNGLLARATAFERELTDLGFAMPPIISTWAADVGKHWAQRVNERVIRTIRDLVVKAQWETVVVERKPARVRRRNPRSRQHTPTEGRRAQTNGNPSTPDAVSATEGAATHPKTTPARSKASTTDVDHGWGFESAPPTPADVTTRHVPPSEQAATQADTAGPSMGPQDVSGDDAWGFDDDHQASISHTNGGAAVDGPDASVQSGDDAWGFAEDEAASPSKRVETTSDRPSTPSLPEPEAEDAWGFEDQTSPKQSTPATSVRVGHQRAESLTSWGWDQDENQADSKAGESKAKTKSTKRLGAKVVNGSPAKAVPKAAPHVVVEFTISSSTQQILSVSKQMLADAKRLHEADFPHASFARAALAVQHSCLDVLDYYRATMAVQHAKLLDSVPALGMQFANDCEWLSLEMVDLDIDEIAGPAFLALAESTRAAQLSAQQAILSESLDEASGFRNTSDPTRFAACERAMKQVTHTLERLSHVWKPPSLTRDMYGRLMGELVNGVLARVLQEIADQDDISESDSKRLDELCKMLHGLESVFVEAGNSTVAVHVPLWFKFVFLSELLEASLADIMFLYEEGHLVDYRTSELIKLIRALFSDSSNRAKAIDTIRSKRQLQAS